MLITSRSDYTILAANEQFERAFGYAEEDLVGNIPSEVGMWAGDHTESELQKRLSSEAPMRTEMISVYTANGTLRRVPLALDRTSDDHEECLVWRFPVQRDGPDDTFSPNQEEGYDPLTGLATRSSLLHQVGQRLEHAPSDEAGPALLCVTIREYRDVTESFGYRAGQQFLAAVATRIEDGLPTTATTARISEDTFAILLRASEDDARELGRTLLKAFDMPFRIADQQVPVEAIAGLAVWSGPHSAFSGAEEMLEASFSAMHRGTKEHTTGNLHIYRDRTQREARWLRRRERLRTAIQQDELVLHYQPIVHLASRSVVGAEALVRWAHPERGLLSPAAFMPLAEETGLVGDVDRWVINRALRQASAWTRSPDGPVDWVSVNVSPQSVDDDFQRWCRDEIRSARLPDGGLHLEITERWALQEDEFLRPLRDDGVRLAIDDFGTGYSSLRYLRFLDAELLKIDREFIQDLGQDPKTTAIVQFLLNLSLRLSVEVIAEGVETAQQEATLRELGCAMAQGYRFLEPVPADSLAEHAHASPEQSGASRDEPQPPS
ncbi:MAG: EAL domain-containing protein [Salinibacter sp.]|uniref:EAL domain-containing protein n=1 Tax=Salinibacter sp. TaxID=2065818 RepID=UPI0035D3FA61